MHKQYNPLTRQMEEIPGPWSTEELLGFQRSLDEARAAGDSQAVAAIQAQIQARPGESQQPGPVTVTVTVKPTAKRSRKALNSEKGSHK